MDVNISDSDFEDMAREHKALLSQYGRVQMRCTELVARQAAQIAALQADVIRLRGELVVRDTALAYMREDMVVLQEKIPGLPTRVTLAHRVESLTRRVQDLMRERLHRQVSIGDGAAVSHDASAAGRDNEAALEANKAAADLVICQTGCVSHDDYWREQDQCRRTGEQCVLVEQPQAMQFVRSAEVHADNAMQESVMKERQRVD